MYQLAKRLDFSLKWITVKKQLKQASNTELLKSQEVEAVKTKEVTNRQSAKLNCPICEQLCEVSQGVRTHLARKVVKLYDQSKN